MKVSVAIALSTAAIALTGCTTTEAGTAVPMEDPPETSATSSTEVAPDVPTVAEPLDASRYLADPCAVLTPAQLTSYGVSRTGKPDTTSAGAENSGPTCLWFGEQRSINVAVSWLTPIVNGLADIYEIQEEDNLWAHFEAIEVEEYPAVFNYFSDDPQHGNCHATVGISDRLVYTVYIQGLDSIDVRTSCDLVVEVAEAVITMVKENP